MEKNTKAPLLSPLTKVGAYCRVSTDHTDQANSFETQRAYFKYLIEKNPEWQLVKIYADKGLTGTSTEHRDEFNQMIQDALHHKIDLILTKEVSRFARNTLDVLRYTRSLKSIGVYIIFANDSINTKDADAEARLTHAASSAQEESRKTSERVKWGMDRKMEDGYVMGHGIYGYSLEKGVLSVNPLEADVIKYIYHEYLDNGRGQLDISKELIAQNAQTGKFLKRWSKTAISRILTNEKYCGDLKIKKRITPNYLDHKTVPNNEEDIRCLQNHHEAIIDRETWLKVQVEIERRNSLIQNNTHYSNRFWASGKVKCGECNSGCVSRAIYNKDGSANRYWHCKEAYVYGPSQKAGFGCDSSLVNDLALLECVRVALKSVLINKDTLLETIADKLNAASKIPECKSPLPKVEREIDKATEKISRLIDLYLDEKITDAELATMKEVYTKKIDSLNAYKEKLLAEAAILKNSTDNFSKLIECVQLILKQEDYNEKLYRDILNKIVLYKNHDVDVYFKYFNDPIPLHYTVSGRKSTYHVDCKLRTADDIVS